MKIADRINSIPASPTLAITAKAKALQADGVDVLSFGAGEPDFATPEPICQAAIAAIQQGHTHYTAVGGLPALKEAIREYTVPRTSVQYSDQEIIASCGAKHTLYNLFLAMLDPGDEVIIIAPYWVSYPVMVQMAGGKPVIIRGAADNSFLPTPAQLDGAVSSRTRAIIINNPSNPSGALWDADAMRSIATWLERNPQVAVVSDAIYDALAYDGIRVDELLHVAPALRSRYVHVNGISKAFAMTGWRLGWACGPAEIVSAMQKLQSQSTSNPTSITQHAAIAACHLGEEVIAPMRSTFQRRRDLISDGLRSLDGVTLVQPRGAFYAFPDFTAWIGRRTDDGTVIADDMSLAAWLLDRAQVAVVPGSAFGAPGFLRLSYATHDDNIEKGIQRLAQAAQYLD
ncbi:MAG: pyridoxal phosphate-dependent aminotransferase [Deltaproteobacteria bacterium]|nr:MAG: pyridoxal phosphate-dependent aminotransferase [Deltaproteobacteria bacterium]